MNEANICTFYLYELRRVQSGPEQTWRQLRPCRLLPEHSTTQVQEHNPSMGSGKGGIRAPCCLSLGAQSHPTTQEVIPWLASVYSAQVEPKGNWAVEGHLLIEGHLVSSALPLLHIQRQCVPFSEAQHTSCNSRGWGRSHCAQSPS